MNYIDNVRNEWINWPSSYDWDVCGTLNFAVAKKPNLELAQQHWSSFWHRIDRLCYGQSRGNQQRVARFVYAHSGANGDNPHIHFLAQSPIDPKEFSILLNAIWSGMSEITAIADQNEILPVFSKRSVAGYLRHEDRGYETNGFNDVLTHLPETRSALRQNALPKLTLAANRFRNLHNAASAYDKHLAAAELRFTRRIAN